MASVLEQADSAVAWKPRSVLIGVLLANRYRVTAPVGQGSTGAVYRADDLLLNRPVALRILVPALAQDPALISRIRARIERNLKIQQAQPDALVNLVDAFDVGMTLEGELYIVTDFLDGDHTASMLERGGPLPWSRARHLVIRLGQILHELHQRGVVLGTLQARHCYVVRNRPKTEAIKITSTAVLEHIATHLGAASGPAGAQMARYAAPERACGDPIDARADIYSLGVIAYELLTGRLPFVDTNPIRLVALHLHAPPPPLRQVAPSAGISAAVEDAILKALAKTSEARYASMEDFTAALSAIPEHDVAGATAPFKPLGASLPNTLDTLTAPAPPVSSVAAALGIPAVEPAPAPGVKVAPSVVMRGVLDAPSPATPPTPPVAPAPPPIVPPPAVGPRRPPSLPIPTLIPSLRMPSKPVPAAVPSAISPPTIPAAPPLVPPPAAPIPAPPIPGTPAVLAPLIAPPTAPAPTTALTDAAPPATGASTEVAPPTTAASTDAAAPATAASTEVAAPATAASTEVAAAATAPSTEVAAPATASESSTATADAAPAPESAAPAADAESAPSDALAPSEPEPAAPAGPVLVDLPPLAAAAAESAASSFPSLAAPLSAPVTPAETAPPAAEPATKVAAVLPISQDRIQKPAARADLSAKTDDEPASWTAARMAVQAQIADDTVRAPSLRRGDQPSESVIAELPRRRFPWLPIVGFGAAIAASAAAYIQTRPEPLPPGGRAPAQQLPPTAIAQNTSKIPEPIAPSIGDTLGEAPQPATPDPVDVAPPPEEPTPEEPTPDATPEPVPEPAPATKTSPKKSDEPRKKSTKKKSVEPEEHEEDVFDQLRKHMEAKKAAEAARQPQPQPQPQPTPQPAAPKPADDSATKAKDTLDRARQAAAQGNHALAYSLAKQSNSLSKSSEALELMGISACKAGNADNARAAVNQLTGARRTAVASACAQKGITL